MKVEFDHSFIKFYNKRFAGKTSIREKFQQRLQIFQENQSNPILEDHALKGRKLGLRSFSVAGDIRVVYRIENNVAHFMNIGSHNQVY